MKNCSLLTYISREKRHQLPKQKTNVPNKVYSEQGDQIGRIFDHWVIANFAVAQILGHFFPQIRKVTNAFILTTKNGFGYIFYEFVWSIQAILLRKQPLCLVRFIIQ
jgi:hypothetical protein